MIPEIVVENKHLILWIVIIYCAYLLYKKNQGQKFTLAYLPMIGGAAYGLNFLTTLIN